MVYTAQIWKWIPPDFWVQFASSRLPLLSIRQIKNNEADIKIHLCQRKLINLFAHTRSRPIEAVGYYFVSCSLSDPEVAKSFKFGLYLLCSSGEYLIVTGKWIGMVGSTPLFLLLPSILTPRSFKKKNKVLNSLHQTIYLDGDIFRIRCVSLPTECQTSYLILFSGIE